MHSLRRRYVRGANNDYANSHDRPDERFRPRGRVRGNLFESVIVARLIQEVKQILSNRQILRTNV